MYKIEKNIPIATKQLPPRAKYPFAKLEIGDSFLVKPSDRKTYVNLYQAIQRCKRQSPPPLKFITRRTENGIRCWRVPAE